MRQHLAAVQISSAETERVALRSQALCFIANEIHAGDYRFSIGTAGSTTLLPLTLLPALLLADGAAHLILEGDTHNPFAPLFDFIEHAFLPLINRMGPAVAIKLECPGFYPAGGGRITVEIKPCPRLSPLHLPESDSIFAQRAMRSTFTGTARRTVPSITLRSTTKVGMWTRREKKRSKRAVLF